MRQHPDDFHDEDLDPYDRDNDDLEELGTPVYQGSSLSVRALTAEELQRFLDAHHDQPAELLGSGWPPPTHLDSPPGSLDPAGRNAASAGRAAQRQPGQPRPLGPGRRPPPPQRGAGRLDPQPGLAGATGRRRRPHRPRARRPDRHTWGRTGWPGGRCAGGLAAAVSALRAGPQLAAPRRRGAAHRLPAGPAPPRRLRGVPRPSRARLARQRRLR
jgi:hypothetical protein